MFIRPFAKIVAKMIFFLVFRIGNDSFTFLLHRNLLLLFNAQIRWISLFPEFVLLCGRLVRTIFLNFFMKFKPIYGFNVFTLFSRITLCTRWMNQDSCNSMFVEHCSIKWYQCMQDESHFLSMIHTWLKWIKLNGFQVACVRFHFSEWLALGCFLLLYPFISLWSKKTTHF